MDRYHFTQALRRRNLITDTSVEFIDSYDTVDDLNNDCNRFLALVIDSLDHERREVNDAVQQERRELLAHQ